MSKRVILELEESMAAKLGELAAAGGMSIEQLLATFVYGTVPLGKNNTNSERSIRAFEEWVSSFDSSSPPLCDNAVSRDRFSRPVEMFSSG